MKKLYSVVIALLGAALVLALVACGGASQQKRFQGREARDASEMTTYADEGRKIAEARRSQVTDWDANEGDLVAAAHGDFIEGNQAYRKGEYEQAVEQYRKVIEEAPTHMGANVNLVLSLLQTGKTEEALTQAIACVFLYSNEPGVVLNAQVAGVACGFSAADTVEVLQQAIKKAEYMSPIDLVDGSSVEQDFAYNQLWDDIDLELYDVAQGTATDGKGSYGQLVERLRELEEMDKDRVESGTSKEEDKDLGALGAFLDAAGSQLGIGLS